MTEKKTEKPGLTYAGPGHIIGIPAKDLTDEDLTRIAKDRHMNTESLRMRLTQNGLYTERKQKD